MTEDRTRTLLELLIQVNREVAAALDLRIVLQRLLFAATQNVGGERGSIVVLDDTGKPIDSTIIFGASLREHTTQQLKETVDRGLAGWVIQHREAVLVPDTSRDERWIRRADDETNLRAKSAICVPLLAREHLVGVLTLVHSMPNAFTSEHLDLMQAIADQASIAVFNARLYNELQNAHQRYRELFEESIDPIFITDWDGKIIEANREAAHLSEIPAQDLRRMGIEQLHDVKSNVTGIQFESLRAGNEGIYESVLRKADSSAVPVEVHVRRVQFEDTDSIQWTLRDITERKELDSLRDDLTAMIYHDLRSPLANIVSSLEILSGMIGADESIRSILGIAVNSTERIQRLVNSLLDINRLESGQTTATLQTISPEKLIQIAVNDVMPTANGRHQKIEIHTAANLPNIFVDADMIRRVLINLLENATKFSSVEGIIEIGAKADGTYVQFWINDNGPGIPANARERIFEKFARLKGREKPGGLGIGLAFCRLAVQAHGGKIWVESEEGQGSKFIFVLPTMEERVPKN
jgi:NtrC-family two-component system sensor histidine kinase KinB